MTNKPVSAQVNSADLRAKLETLNAFLNTKQAQHAELLEQIKEAEVSAIVTGRRSQSATLRNKASELATEIEQARVSYDHLTAALERLLANETEEARQAEDKLVADLDVERAKAVQELVTAIEKPSRRAVDRACNRLAEIRFLSRKAPAASRDTGRCCRA